jgi:hypothetical protein
MWYVQAKLYNNVVYHLQSIQHQVSCRQRCFKAQIHEIMYEQNQLHTLIRLKYNKWSVTTTIYVIDFVTDS